MSDLLRSLALVVLTCTSVATVSCAGPNCEFPDPRGVITLSVMVVDSAGGRVRGSRVVADIHATGESITLEDWGPGIHILYARNGAMRITATMPGYQPASREITVVAPLQCNPDPQLEPITLQPE